MRAGYAVTLPSGTVAEVLVPTVAEVLMARRAAGREMGLAGAERASLALCKIVTRKVNDAPYTVAQPWPLRLGDTNTLRRSVGDLAMPSDDDLASAASRIDVTDDGTRAVWTVTLPNGEKVALREQSTDDSFALAACMDREGGLTQAGLYARQIEGVRRCSGTPATVETWPWTAAETELLGDAFHDLHGMKGAERPTMVPLTV